MKIIGLFVVTYVLFTQSIDSAAAQYKPPPDELVPTEKIVCEWSKMPTEEYKQCVARKKYYGKMSPEEKKKQNEEVLEREKDVVKIRRGSSRATVRPKREGKENQSP